MTDNPVSPSEGLRAALDSVLQTRDDATSVRRYVNVLVVFMANYGNELRAALADSAPERALSTEPQVRGWWERDDPLSPSEGLRADVLWLVDVILGGTSFEPHREAAERIRAALADSAPVVGLDAEELARAMGAVLPNYLMPNPAFDEADDPFPDWDGAFGGRRDNGEPIMAVAGDMTLGEVRVQHYLSERRNARALYQRLAEAILAAALRARPDE